MFQTPGTRDEANDILLTTNDAAERLREDLRERYGSAGLVDEALAAERRATVERIRAALGDSNGSIQEMLAILDAEGRPMNPQRAFQRRSRTI